MEHIRVYSSDTQGHLDQKLRPVWANSSEAQRSQNTVGQWLKEKFTARRNCGDVQRINNRILVVLQPQVRTRYECQYHQLDLWTGMGCISGSAISQRLKKSPAMANTRPGQANLPRPNGQYAELMLVEVFLVPTQRSPMNVPASSPYTAWFSWDSVARGVMSESEQIWLQLINHHD